MRLDLDVFGDTQFSRELLRMGDRVEDMRPIFRELADDFYELERRQFDSEGGEASGGWRPLAESTLKRKADMNLDPRILHATLALRKSLTERGAPGSIMRITRDELVLGTAVKSKGGFPYPAAHQNPKKGQTQRRVIEFTPMNRVMWVKKIQAYMVGRDRGAAA